MKLYKVDFKTKQVVSTEQVKEYGSPKTYVTVTLEDLMKDIRSFHKKQESSSDWDFENIKWGMALYEELSLIGMDEQTRERAEKMVKTLGLKIKLLNLTEQA